MLAHPRVDSARRHRLALALLVAAVQALLVTRLGLLAGSAVAAAAVPPLGFHLLHGYALRTRTARNVSWLAATAQTLAAATTLAAAAGPLLGLAVAAALAIAAAALLVEPRPVRRRLLVQQPVA